tara:strand:- start:265 stop:474 length:210 start_codon:yes stop_codon:yes gene_type:complete
VIGQAVAESCSVTVEKELSSWDAADPEVSTCWKCGEVVEVRGEVACFEWFDVTVVDEVEVAFDDSADCL